MSKSTIKRSTILLFVFVVSVSLIAADLVVFAQNSNGQDDPTRGGQMTSNGNNTNTGGTGRRRRRGRRSAAATANTGDMGGTGTDTSMQGNTGTGTGMTGGTGRRRRRRRGGGGATTTGAVMTTTTPVADSMQKDISGRYTGTVSCTGLPISGDGTLEVTGNNFSFTPAGGGASISGRIVSVETRGYVATAMQFGESVAPQPGMTSTPPIIISMRSRQSGDRLTLTGVPNTPTKDCSFMPAGGMGGGGRRRRRRSGGAGMGMTSTTTTTDTTTTTTGGGGGGGRRRRGRRGSGNTNANSGGMGNMNMNR